MDDEDIFSGVIPPHWWLTSVKTKYLLVCLVLRGNKEIEEDTVNSAPGPTRCEQRESRAQQIQQERAKAHDRDNSNAAHNQAFKKLKLSVAKQSIIKQQIYAVSIQLGLFNANRDVFIAANGEDLFNQKILKLLNALPDPVQSALEATDAEEDDVAGDGNDDARDGDDAQDRDDA